jgi:hypothetical protein
MPGATLGIDRQTTLENKGSTQKVLNSEGGHLQIDGATIGELLIVAFGGLQGDIFDDSTYGVGYVHGARFGRYSGIRVRGSSQEIEIFDNTFEAEQHNVTVEGRATALIRGNRGNFNVNVQAAASAAIENNCPPPAECGIGDGVGVFNEAAATVRNNTLGDAVFVSGDGARATVVGNAFRVKNQWALRLNHRGVMLATDNVLDLAVPGFANEVISLQGDAVLDARRNTVLGNVAIEQEGGRIDLVDNVLRNGQLSADEGAAVRGTFEGNTFTDGNGLAFRGGRLLAAAAAPQLHCRQSNGPRRLHCVTGTDRRQAELVGRCLRPVS